MKKFDSIIIGSGQAGTPLIFRMAAAGNKVAFIEREHLGGTCVNDGCTPTKAYVASARRMWEARHGEELGINIPEGASADLRKIKKRKDELVRKMAEGIRSGIRENENITFFEGEARFTGEKTVSVNGEELQAEEIYINTGARPVVPPSFREMNYLTNQSVLQLEEVPEHLIIVGGSYTGLEFGQMFRRFGSRVTIVEKASHILGREDGMICEAIQEILEKDGIEIRLNAECVGGKMNPDNSVTVRVNCDEGDPEINGSHLLVAVGRKPNTDALNPGASGIKTDEKGYIQVNDFLETSVKGVYALGDCNGKGAFTHTSYNDYEIIVANKFEGRERKVSDRVMTYGLYIDPPLGRAGMTKKEAGENDYKILEATMPMHKVSRAAEKGETNGLMNIIVDAATRKILGAAILGVGGDEIISSILHIMYADVPYNVIMDSVKPHPTVSELLPSLLEGLEEAG